MQKLTAKNGPVWTLLKQLLGVYLVPQLMRCLNYFAATRTRTWEWQIVSGFKKGSILASFLITFVLFAIHFKYSINFTIPPNYNKQRLMCPGLEPTRLLLLPPLLFAYLWWETIQFKINLIEKTKWIRRSSESPSCETKNPHFNLSY